MYRYDLTDAQWERIAPFFPDRFHRGKAGHPWKDHRPLVNGILWHLHTGAPWPDTPERYGPWQTVYDRFNRWRQDGTWAKILDALLLQLVGALLLMPEAANEERADVTQPHESQPPQALSQTP